VAAFFLPATAFSRDIPGQGHRAKKSLNQPGQITDTLRTATVAVFYRLQVVIKSTTVTARSIKTRTCSDKSSVPGIIPAMTLTAVADSDEQGFSIGRKTMADFTAVCYI